MLFKYEILKLIVSKVAQKSVKVVALSVGEAVVMVFLQTTKLCCGEVCITAGETTLTGGKVAFSGSLIVVVSSFH